MIYVTPVKDGKKQYFFDDEVRVCGNCHNSCDAIYTLYSLGNELRTKVRNVVVCPACLKVMKPRLEVGFWKKAIVVVTEEVGRDWEPVLEFNKFGLQPSGFSVEDVALVVGDGVKVVDRTKFAGRESIEGATIGCDIHDRIVMLDKPLKDCVAAEKLLEDLR